MSLFLSFYLVVGIIVAVVVAADEARDGADVRTAGMLGIAMSIVWPVVVAIMVIGGAGHLLARRHP